MRVAVARRSGLAVACAALAWLLLWLYERGGVGVGVATVVFVDAFGVAVAVGVALALTDLVLVADALGGVTAALGESTLGVAVACGHPVGTGSVGSSVGVEVSVSVAVAVAVAVGCHVWPGNGHQVGHQVGRAEEVAVGVVVGFDGGTAVSLCVGTAVALCVGTAVVLCVGTAVSLGDGDGVSVVGAVDGDGATVVGSTVGIGVSTTGICASWTVTSIAARSGAVDTTSGVGAGGSVIVGWSPPMTTVLPSERTVDWTDGEGVATGAPVWGTGALGSCIAVGAAGFRDWDVAETMTAPSDCGRDWKVVKAMLAPMRIAPMPTAPPTAQTALEFVRTVIPPLVRCDGDTTITRPRKRPRPLKPLLRFR